MSSALIDLHVHTTASDGTLTPREVVRYASGKGLRAIAVTDHDTVAGVDEALAAGAEAGLEVIPGIEISVDYLGEMHILGYYLDHHNSELLHGLKMLQEYRNQRNPKMIAMLRRLGLDMSMDEVTEAAGGNVVGRPHFAAVMVRKGYVRTTAEAFDRYLAADKPAYVKKERLTPREGIDLINSAGGIPVLAHPKYLRVNGGRELENLVRQLADSGLRGLEVHYSTHTPAETTSYLELARRCGLLVTGGTDFHGANKQEIEIGVGLGDLAVSAELLQGLRESKKI